MRVKLSFVGRSAPNPSQTYVLSTFSTDNLGPKNQPTCCVCLEKVTQGQSALTTGCPCSVDTSVGHFDCFTMSAARRSDRDTLVMRCFANAHPVHLGEHDDDVFPPRFYDALSHFGDDDRSDTASTVAPESTEENPYEVTKEQERLEMYNQFGEGRPPAWKLRDIHEMEDRFGRGCRGIAEWKMRFRLSVYARFGELPLDKDEDFLGIPRNFFLYEGADEPRPSSSQSNEAPPTSDDDEEYDDDTWSTAADYGADDVDFSEWNLQTVPQEENEQFFTPTGSVVEGASS